MKDRDLYKSGARPHRRPMQGPKMTTNLHIVEASIAQLRQALEAGTVTSVELVGAYLRRIARYDRHGITLNAVPVLNPTMFEEAAASDRRRRNGAALGPLDGIPYTAKDSYKVSGLTVAAGSPAFEHLVANEDAFTIGRLRAGGAVLIGLTNMPPMANGGMQRGVYGRAESPYNADYLTAAFASGSSNGSGTATAASFAAFGLGEETWSSGRAPASNNALVAYTPSRGVISVRGNWPLVPTMDVVVPHTRSVPDMLELLDVIVADDPNTSGDFWRAQPWVALPKSSDVRPPSYTGLELEGALRGKRLGVPRMYIGRDTEADEPIETRASVLDLWQQAARRSAAARRKGGRGRFSRRLQLRARPAGHKNHGRSRAGSARIRRARDLGSVRLRLGRFSARQCRSGDSRSCLGRRRKDLSAAAGHAAGPLWRRVLTWRNMSSGPSAASRHSWPFPTLEAGLKGLEATRRIDFEDWLDAQRARRSGVSRRRRCRAGRCGCQRGLRCAGLAQRHLGRQRQSGVAPSRHSDRHRADGRDGRYRHAGRPQLRRQGL